VTFDLILMQCF